VREKPKEVHWGSPPLLLLLLTPPPQPRGRELTLPVCAPDDEEEECDAAPLPLLAAGESDGSEMSGGMS
jgi:hypothetical protein